VLAAKHRTSEAEKLLRESCSLQEQLACEFHDSPVYQQEWARLCCNLAVMLGDTGRIREAEATCRQALMVVTPLTQKYPRVPIYRQNRAQYSVRVANYLRAAARDAEAVEMERQAIGLWAALAEEAPTVPGHREELARCHVRLARLLRKLDRPSEAEAAYQQALTACERLVKDFPGTAQFRELLATYLNEFAWFAVTRDKPDPARAVELAMRAVELAPTKRDYQGTLGTAYYRAGNWEAARSALQRATELRGTAYEWFFLAMTLHRLGDAAGARQKYDLAVSWTDKEKPDDAELRRFRAEAAALLGLPAPN
jgi:tetratricopeptide (TPR) repeat protein